MSFNGLVPDDGAADDDAVLSPQYLVTHIDYGGYGACFDGTQYAAGYARRGAVRGTDFDSTPLIIPTRGHLDSIKILIKRKLLH